MWNYIHIYFQYAIKEDKKTQRYYNIKYIKIRDCVRKQSLKWSFVSPYAIEMAYSFSCSFFNILHVLNTCRFLFPYIKPTYVLYLLVYFSILLYRNESERRSWKEVQMAMISMIMETHMHKNIVFDYIMMNDDDCIIDG